MYDVWAKSKAPPEALESKPDLSPYLTEAYKAFRILSTRRPVGFSGICPIPMTDILAYVTLFAIEDIEDFVAWVTVADLAFIKHVRSMKKVEVKDEK